MRITADTNVLVRVLVDDDSRQTPIAKKALSTADKVAFTLPALCELVWVLSRLYKRRPSDIAAAIRMLTNGDNVAVNRSALAAGLAHLDEGGDFADGVIAYEGEWLGAETFASFDRKAVERVLGQGRPARLLT